METSQSIVNIAKALLAFNIKVEKISKDSQNPFFKSNYASLPHIQEAIQIPLAESDLVYSQMPSGQNGLCTILIHAETGEYFKDTFIMPVSKANDPQAVGSSITYAKRYALVAMLGLNIDEDDDANKGSGNKSTASTPASKALLNPNTPQWNEAITFLKGSGSIDKIKSKYSISKENETKLMTAVMEVA